MHPLVRAIAAGASGAAATNLLHETVRRIVPAAPRVDLLGMQAMAKMYRAAGSPSPTGPTLYRRTLVGDLLSNAAYFAIAALVPRRVALPAGAALGIAAGVGAVTLPKPLGLTAATTARTPATSALTVALYAAGGVVAGLTATRTD